MGRHLVMFLAILDTIIAYNTVTLRLCSNTFSRWKGAKSHVRQIYHSTAGHKHTEKVTWGTSSSLQLSTNRQRWPRMAEWGESSVGKEESSWVAVVHTMMMAVMRIFVMMCLNTSSSLKAKKSHLISQQLIFEDLAAVSWPGPGLFNHFPVSC